MSAKMEVTLDDAMEMGIRHFNANNLILAERIFRDVISSVGDHAPALHYLGLTCYYRGNMPEAVKYTDKALKKEPKNISFLNNHAAVMFQTGQQERSLKFIDRALAVDPKNADTWSNKANTLWHLKRYKDSEKCARKAVDLNPKHPDALLNLGNALVGQGQYEEAIKYWRKTAKLRPQFDKPWNNLGNALRELGKLKESEEMCLKALELNPKSAQALNNLGNTRRDLGRPKEAEECYRKAIALMPSFPESHNNLAVALLDQHRYQEALEAARYAAAFRSDYAEAHGNMSFALREMGNLDEAEVHAQKAVTLQPENPSHYLDLADVLFLAERFDEAEAALKEAQKLEPDSARILVKLAGVLERANRLPEALEAIDKALKKSPESPELHYRKGMFYFMSGMVEESETRIMHALKLKPDMAAGYGSLAEIMQTKGDMKGSYAMTRKALKFGKNNPFLYFTLSKAKTFTKSDPDLKKMLDFLKHEKAMGKLNAASLHFALFKAYEDLRDYKKAFHHLKAGNDLKRQTISYDSSANKATVDNIIKTYGAGITKAFAGKGCKSARPIFIVGMPRSGTTLTEQIISSHPDVYGAGELTAMNLVDKQFSSMKPENAAAMGQAYIDAVVERYPEAGKSRHFTDKMPGNFIRIGQIVATLPDAKIIHCRRDSIDTCLSCYKQMFARGQHWSYTLEELAEQYKVYEDLMAHWRKVFPGRFLEVDYEDTVNNLEKQARRMIEFIGLPWNDACLLPHKQKRNVMTASKTQVIKPVYKTSVKGWKRYEKELQPLIKGLKAKRLAGKSSAGRAGKATKKRPAAKKKTAGPKRKKK